MLLNSNIRVIEKAGEPWWVAKDACDYFGDTRRSRKGVYANVYPWWESVYGYS